MKGPVRNEAGTPRKRRRTSDHRCCVLMSTKRLKNRTRAAKILRRLGVDQMLRPSQHLNEHEDIRISLEP